MPRSKSADVFAIEMDARDKSGGAILRVAMFETEKDAREAWSKLETSEDPDVWYWLVRIRDGVDDPAHVDCLEVKCRDGELP